MVFMQEDQCFMQKLITIFLKIVEKSYFWTTFDHFLVIFAQTGFFCKNSKQFHREP